MTDFSQDYFSREGYLFFWRPADEYQEQQAKDALGVLALIHNFDPEDLQLITLILAEPDKSLRRDLEDQIHEETGIDFGHLTREQWKVISSEIGGAS